MLKIVAVTLALTVVISSCQLTQKTQVGSDASNKEVARFNLEKAMREADTAAIAVALKADWRLEKICHSTFVGLKCDSSMRQRWLIDSLGGITWVNSASRAITKTKTPFKDTYTFVSRSEAEGGEPEKDTVWVMHLEDSHRNLMIQVLDSARLQLVEYPLIADNTTTYYLKK